MGATSSSPSRSEAVVIAKSVTECRVETASDKMISSVWFSSPPIKQSILQQLKSIQLVTVGHVEDIGRRGCGTSWFELSICRPSDDFEPRTNFATNTQLVWRSHDNSPVPTDSQLQGQVFSVSHPLIQEIEAGDIVVVKLCVQNGPVASRGIKGRIVLMSGTNELGMLEPKIPAYDFHSFSATGPLFVQATDHYVAAKLWFSTPPLDQECISKISEIQISTRSRDQGWVSDPDAGCYSWFDLVILASPKDELSVLREGHFLAWHSHSNPVALDDFTVQSGKTFGRTDEIYQLLRPGDSID
ncbi:hypothetical protein RhiJN_08103 [Ceratobasidium sp. AG-Ba]|nr:hypothetical protein RhiJN_08103 [Ceratobasidium sp. AG-Ba]QRW08859.1 hypothetical protein RhiLY_07858 [Ceratobasidium sp. AG-Ba]